MSTILHFINQSCFTLEHADHKIIFDPFLDGNPQGIKPADLKVEYILLSHAHFDHLGCASELAKANRATVISTKEVCDLFVGHADAHAMHLGGTHRFDFGTVRIVPALHGSGVPGGCACGFIIDFYGTTLYFAGDTAVFGDMALLQKLMPFKYAVLPIGDNFTMGPKDARLATELLKPEYVIPVHYNTWPLIAQNPEQFKADVEATTATKVLVVPAGSSIELK